MKPSDQTVKLRIVLATAALALVGFVLEVGPAGGAFTSIVVGLAIELPALGFLPYLALAAGAAIGLHLSETEPTPKADTGEIPPAQTAASGEVAGQRVRVRPELHQFRMFAAALGGYVLLKGMGFALMVPRARAYGLGPDDLTQALQFGFFYVALGWFVLWQLLRWFALRRRWVRLQEELVGSDVARMIAAVILIKPAIFFVTMAFGGGKPLAHMEIVLWTLVHLAVVMGAVVLWQARPHLLRRAVVGLLTTGAIILVLAIVQLILELTYYRPV